MRFCITILFIMVLAELCPAQTDTMFWFAVPEISASSNYNDRPISIVIMTNARAANVTISQPATGAPMPPISITVPANSIHKEDLTAYVDMLETKPPATALNYGLKVVSDVPVSAYYEVLGIQPGNIVANPEIFALKGANALGRTFYIPSQNYVPNHTPGYIPLPYSSFDIVATEDNTTVVITPRSNLQGGHTAGVPVTITLNSGQTWSATANSLAAADHLPGSRVEADKPVAITVKDDLLRSSLYPGGCADLTGDQIVPVDMLGTEYIAINSGLLNGPGDQLFVTATRNNTAIFRDGNAVATATINAGDTYRLPAAATPGQTSTYIRASEPVAVWHLTGAGCEMGATQLPQMDCSGSDTVSYVRALNHRLHVNLMVRNGGQGSFFVNGVPLTAAFSSVPGTGGVWQTAQVNLSAQVPQGGSLRITNAAELFHVSILDEGTHGNSYGYFSNYNSVSAKAASSAGRVCEGEPLQLFARSVHGSSYEWTGPGGFRSIQQNPIIPQTPLAGSGWYHLDVTGNSHFCGSGRDSVYVAVQPLPDMELGADITSCSDTVLLQAAAPGMSYRWSTGAATGSVAVTRSGTYWVELTDTAGCKKGDTITVTLVPPPETDLGPDRVLCDKDLPVILSGSTGPATAYLWSDGTSGPQMTVNRSGSFWLREERNGCTGSDTITVTAVPTPALDLGPDTTICSLVPAEIGAEVPGAIYTWNTGATASHIMTAASGTYILTVNVSGCIVRDTIVVTAVPAPEVSLGPNRDICSNEVAVLDASYGSNTRYLWSTGDTTAAIEVAAPGRYWVQVTADGGCAGGDTVTLSHYPDPEVFLGSDTVVCEETPLVLQPRSLFAESFVWSDGSTDSRLVVTLGGAYTVTGINKCGAASDTLQVKQIFCDIWVPNTFTPNNDGTNDVFRVLGNTAKLQGFRLSVFNRWGQRVFYTEDKYRGWDGSFEGREAMLGTYVYMLEYSIGGKPYLERGNFHLLR